MITRRQSSVSFKKVAQIPPITDEGNLLWLVRAMDAATIKEVVSDTTLALPNGWSIEPDARSVTGFMIKKGSGSSVGGLSTVPLANFNMYSPYTVYASVEVSSVGFDSGSDSYVFSSYVNPMIDCRFNSTDDLLCTNSGASGSIQVYSDFTLGAFDNLSFFTHLLNRATNGSFMYFNNVDVTRYKTGDITVGGNINDDIIIGTKTGVGILYNDLRIYSGNHDATMRQTVYDEITP